MAKNPDEERESKVFITENSISKHLPKLFGYKSEFISKRFYILMTGRQPGREVTFPSYMSFLSPLLLGDQYLQQLFIFNLYDINGDEIVGSSDLVEIQKHVAPSSVLGEELEMLADHIVTTRIRTKLLRDVDIITITTFR